MSSSTTRTTALESSEVLVPAGAVHLTGDLTVPAGATGMVLFAHGSGSSRFSSRNRKVAGVLQQAALATLLIDLLTEDEEGLDRYTAELRFDIPMLAGRLVAIADWLGRQPSCQHLPLGCFGASTGAAAALIAAAERPGRVEAVVSRGGRPDLAGPALRQVRAPALFIVGSRDQVVLDLNRDAIRELPLTTEHRLEIVNGATHLFEEPGALDQVAALARDWFRAHLIA